MIGREGTSLENRTVTISMDRSCRISNLNTGEQLKNINFDYPCSSIAVDKAQTVIAVGTDTKVTFIESTNFAKVKEITFNSAVYSNSDQLVFGTITLYDLSIYKNKVHQLHVIFVESIFRKSRHVVKSSHRILIGSLYRRSLKPKSFLCT